MKLEFGEKHRDAQYRKSVGAIIYNPKTQKVLGLDWGLYDVYGIVQGGQEDGEDEKTCLMREIIEETGYTDFGIIEKLGENIISYFYVDVKSVWRALELSCYFVVLNSEAQDEQELEDNENFELKWVDIDEFIQAAKNHNPTKSENFQGILELLNRAKRVIKTL